jgi:hypothetical protein
MQGEIEQLKQKSDERRALAEQKRRNGVMIESMGEGITI